MIGTPYSNKSVIFYNAFPQSNTRRLRPYLSIFFPVSEWNNQYYVGQRFEFIVKDKGELSLKPVDKT